LEEKIKEKDREYQQKQEIFMKTFKDEYVELENENKEFRNQKS